VHEFAIAESLIKIATEQAAKNGAAGIFSVRVKVGKMTSVVPEALHFAFDTLSKGTLLEGAKLVIDEVPLTVSCAKCGKSSELDEPAFQCPHCSATDLKIVTGRELHVDSMEID
jgi:hydrogenase nickel incorporation protein HypA/HybF